MKKVDYRYYARQALQFARKELLADEHVRLLSAALQLRMAMEALTYDRMQVYVDEIPPEKYATWQPKRVMDLLLEIDADADKDSSLAVGIEETYGVSAKEMQFLGTEKVLDTVTIRRHYDALGSYLHMPTLKQIGEGKNFDTTKLRTRCAEIADGLESVLASPISNIRFAIISEIQCVYCTKPMWKRAPMDEKPVPATCFECGAGYTMISVGENKVRWEPLRTKVSCPTSGCDHTFMIGNHKLKLGATWGCPQCRTRWTVCYGFASSALSEADNPSAPNDA